MLGKKILRIARTSAKLESGIALLEVLVALALLGLIGVAYLAGSGTATRSAITADEQATAENLARDQMEYVKGLSYVAGATNYPPATIPAEVDYTGYSASIAVAPLPAPTATNIPAPDNTVQQVIVTISRNGEQLFRLQGYKAAR